MNLLLPLALASTMLALSSCGLSGSLGAVRERLPGMPKMPKVAMPSIPKIGMPSMPKVAMPKIPQLKRGDIARFSWGDLLPSRVPIVEVREKDLQEMQLGRDKALAYQKEGGFFPSWFGGAVDFKEPELPSGTLDNPEFGLLPPKSE
jgi:hypothetical protein